MFCIIIPLPPCPLDVFVFDLYGVYHVRLCPDFDVSAYFSQLSDISPPAPQTPKKKKKKEKKKKRVTFTVFSQQNF